MKNIKDQLLAISPIDGRYRRHVEELSQYCSEFALIRYRVRVEVEWFKFLVNHLQQLPTTPSSEQLVQCDEIWRNFSVDDAETVRNIEAKTNHDVKAVEYFVKDAVSERGLGEVKELIHFGCTSEDINNLAYALMLKEARHNLVQTSMTELVNALTNKAEEYADQPMLSRTHGQVASPTTLGKELVNVAVRLKQWCLQLANVNILGKMNGAVGNFNAHQIAKPELSWEKLSHQFVENFGLSNNPFTTQIEPHDWIAHYFNALIGFNQVVLDLDRDIWSYISIGYFKQQQVEGETGSSTMPHKVNPIDFENSEGNIGIANSIARHLSDKLLISRWQRDLSDSTVLRNVGVVLAHTEVAIRSTLRGLNKLDVDRDRMARDLATSWEVLGEAVQTVLRKQGGEDPYETLKRLTRGESLNQETYLGLLKKLSIDEPTQRNLSRLTPELYTGVAQELTHQAIRNLREI